MLGASAHVDEILEQITGQSKGNVGGYGKYICREIPIVSIKIIDFINNTLIYKMAIST